MKRLIVFSLAVALAGVLVVSAQSALPQTGTQGTTQQAMPAGPLPQAGVVQRLLPASLSGTLAFVDEAPVIKVGETSYLIVMPRFYYYAYVEGFKAGMAVSARGRVLRAPDLAKASVGAPGSAPVILIFIPEELSINGKTYVIVGQERASMPGGPDSPFGGSAMTGASGKPGLPDDPSSMGPTPGSAQGGQGWSGYW
ncbi:MAG TPA: hypothetical protein VMV44_07985 [Rectinemataceae bacterium]|nr:hypothetical protein [Rectinemataceae bacterium]